MGQIGVNMYTCIMFYVNRVNLYIKSKGECVFKHKENDYQEYKFSYILIANNKIDICDNINYI